MADRTGRVHELVAVVVIAAFLTINFVWPTVALVRPGSTPFSWQMFSRFVTLPHLILVDSTGAADTTGLSSVQAVPRLEIRYDEVFARRVCQARGDLAMVSVVYRRDSTVTVHCP